MGVLELVTRLVSGVALLLINGMFVTTEFALTRLRQHNREEMTSRRGLRLAWDMTRELEIYLTACQLGITVTSILLGVVFEPGVTRLITPLMGLFGLGVSHTTLISIGLSVVLIQLMHTVWGEQTPTYLGVEKPKKVAAVFAPLLYGWTWFVYPLIYVGDHLSKYTLRVFGVSMTRSWTEQEDQLSDHADLRREMGELLSKGELSDERRQEVLNTLELGRTKTESIMVERENIQAISRDRSVEENLNMINRSRHSRYPLVDGSIDQYRGAIYVPGMVSRLNQIQDGKATWQDIAVEVMTVSPDLSVNALVDQFQEEQQEMALVVEEGRVRGLVTSTDAFESVAGELRDPFD